MQCRLFKNRASSDVAKHLQVLPYLQGKAPSCISRCNCRLGSPLRPRPPTYPALTPILHRAHPHLPRLMVPRIGSQGSSRVAVTFPTLYAAFIDAFYNSTATSKSPHGICICLGSAFYPNVHHQTLIIQQSLRSSNLSRRHTLRNYKWNRRKVWSGNRSRS